MKAIADKIKKMPLFAIAAILIAFVTGLIFIYSGIFKESSAAVTITGLFIILSGAMWFKMYRV